jgi:hypothetical protein
VHFTTVGLGDLVHFLEVSQLLDVGGFLQIKLVLMVKVDRLKTRLVVKCYTQVFGFDYGDTFFPVTKMTSVCLFLSMATICHWSLHQLDIKNAFLHDDLIYRVYMEKHPGFVAQGESTGLVWHQSKSLYDLKQSLRAWFSKYRNVQQFCMIRSESGHSIFCCHSTTMWI